MNEVKISAVIPVFNCEKYLKRCLDSIINQSLVDIEIIIINDGSNDRSEDIIMSYYDERIKYIYQTNNGQSVCRNRGIDIASGKYIGFVDRIQQVSPEFIQILVKSCIVFKIF